MEGKTKKLSRVEFSLFSLQMVVCLQKPLGVGGGGGGDL
jgi:hypothetical protein